MIDVEPVIREELERLAPQAETEWPDWNNVLGRTSSHPSRQRPLVRRFALVVAVGLAVAAPALALSSGVRSLLGFERSEPVLTQARLLVSAPVGNGFFAHAWISPSSTGGRCEFLTADRNPITRATSGRSGGGACSASGGSNPARATANVPLPISVSVTRRPKNRVPANWVPPIVSGSVLPSLRATRVEVVWNGGSLPLRLRNNNVLGGSPALYMPPFENFPYVVVAYDAQGNEVAQKRLGSPTLMLMNGWKEYTREYKKWKKSHHRG